MSSDVIERVHALIDGMLANFEVLTRADIDELVVVCEVHSDVFHERFINILENFDKHFDTEYPSYNAVYLERLLRVLKVTQGMQIIASEQIEDLTPEFELGASDKSRIFQLSDAMRKIVFSAGIFDEPHKRRLLNRIAAIEYEVHQEKGRLDVILAGVVDIGDALGKFGEKVEPLTKRMKEISGIARGGSKQYDQIPSPDEPLSLPKPDEE